jgi:hypothetical protein
VHLFANLATPDFETVGALTPVQTLGLAQTADVQDLPVRRALFNNVYSLTLFFSEGCGADSVELFWLGFKGEVLQLSREPVSVLYEKAANPRDHAPVVGTGPLEGGAGRLGE